MLKLSMKQAEKFLSIAGYAFKGHEARGSFNTLRPYNQDDYKGSPWIFSYVIEEDTGNLICELEHRMTNNRIYGWDTQGNELSTEILYRYFQAHF